MRSTILSVCLLAGCAGSSDDGPGGDDDGPGGGTWTGTATVHTVDFNGNVDDITADVTWVEMASDQDGVDYLPTGTVTIARTVPGCTVTFDPASHTIAGETDGFLRVDADTYRGAAGTTWDAAITMSCPPSAPATFRSLVGSGWLTVPAPRPLTAPGQITGHETQGQIESDWTFTRTGTR